MPQATLKLLELVMSSENLIESYGADIEATTKQIAKEQQVGALLLQTQTQVDHQEWVDSMIESNSQKALAVMYIGSILNDLADVMPLVRALDEVNCGAISEATFNKRYEQIVFGDDLA